MRVLMLTQNIAGIGGTYARCYTLARGLASLGHDVTLLTASQKRQFTSRLQEISGVRIIEMGSVLPPRFRHGGFSLSDLFSRLRFIAARHFDVVHTFDHRPTVSIPALAYRHFRQAPIVGDWCDVWARDGLGSHRRGLERSLLTPFDHFLEPWFLARVDAVTAISTGLMTHAQRLGHAGDRVRLLPPSANDDLIQPIPMLEARRKLALPLAAPIVVYSGFTTFGVKLLGEVFVEMARRNPSVVMLTAGGNLKEFNVIVSSAGIDKQLVRFGALSICDLSTVLASGEVMLLPLPDTYINRTSYPNKIADYMAAGRPVVTNPTGDLGRMVQTEGIGLAVEESIVAYVEAIGMLLADPLQREALGRRGRRLAETRFSYRTSARQVEELYRSISGRQ